MNSINLLPPEEKKQLKLGKKRRLAVIFWFLVLFFVVSLIFTLFSVKTYLQFQKEGQKALLLGAEKDFQSPEFLELKEKIRLEKQKKIIAA